MQHISQKVLIFLTTFSSQSTKLIVQTLTLLLEYIAPYGSIESSGYILITDLESLNVRNNHAFLPTFFILAPRNELWLITCPANMIKPVVDII